MIENDIEEEEYEMQLVFSACHWWNYSNYAIVQSLNFE